MRYDLKNLLGWSAAWKLFVLVVIGAGAFLFPFQNGNYFGNFHYPYAAPPDLWTHFKTWDGQIYLYLAREGYGPGQMANAFYPLFPFLIKGVGWVLGGHLFAAGLLLSHVFFFLAMALLFRLFQKEADDRTAFFSCLFLMFYPLGFYFGLIYTEALFLALCAGLFLSIEEKRTWPAVLCGFLLPLSRPTGILLFFPLAVLVLQRVLSKKDRSLRDGVGPALAVLAGFGTYLFLMDRLAGDPFTAFKAVHKFVGHFSIFSVLEPFQWLRENFLDPGSFFPDPFTGSLHRIFFLIYLAGLFVGWKELRTPYGIFCLVLGVVTALSGNMGSEMRYLSILFPMFLILARRARGWEPVLLGGFGALQVFLVLRHSLNYFVS